MPHRRRLLLAAALLLFLAPPVARAQAPPDAAVEEAQDELVQLDFNDVEIAVVIDTIARLTKKNFIYDDRVRGRVTIVSPTRITVDQAYAVFESVLQVKGFTTVPGPGGAIKVIPLREAKETSIETVRGRTPVSDRFITRLIPLRYIDAEAIANTLKPLVSKDAAIVAYTPTNTVILTDSASNIGRILDILGEIDVETYKEELSVLALQHADAATLAEQVSQIYGAEVATATVSQTRRARARTTGVQPGQPGTPASKVRIVTDERTNSLIVLASRQDTQDIRSLVTRLDVPVTGGGRIHVYYLRNADAEELAETLNAMISGQSVAPSSRGGVEQVSATPQALRAAVTELAEGITVTADPGTNSLVIQASQEGFATLSQVIEKLDIPRPQVLVEALIMQVNVTDSQELGFNGIARIVRGDTDYAFGSLTGADARPRFTPRPATGTDTAPTTPPSVGDIADTAISSLIAAASKNTLRDTDGDGVIDRGTLITGIITAAAQDNDTEILSAPHILTTDNEEAEIKVGANIPIITSRVQSAQGITQATSDLATSVNVERQDIGVTLRVTPQISEGDNVRLEIFQEITDIDEGLSVGDPNEVGVPLSNRKVENTVVVADGETVVIGGLISDDYSDTVTKVPWLGDIPFLGWLFKSTDQSLTKQNLLIFLTPHIVREAPELASQTIRKREEFRTRSMDAADLSGSAREREEERRELAEAAGLEPPPDPHEPVRSTLESHERRYPLERMREIEAGRRERDTRAAEEAARAGAGPRYGVLAAVFRDERAATETLTQLLDAGYEGTLVSGESQGTVLFEVRLGPFQSLEEAEQAASVARQAFGLAPTVLVERDEP